jgi:hypothetical protein
MSCFSLCTLIPMVVFMGAACVTPLDEDSRRSAAEDSDEIDASDWEEPSQEAQFGNEFDVAQMTTASASCPWYAMCGDLYNRSGGHQIRIANNWCVSGWTYETWGDWSCGAQMEVPNGRNSDQYSGFEDTDAFRAYKGCITEGYIYTAGGGNTWFKYDRRGKPSIWVKFTDIQDVTITRISC